MKNSQKNLFLLTPLDIRRMQKLVRHLESAIAEIIELKRITTFDDQRRHYSPAESDLIEEVSFFEQQIPFNFGNDSKF